MASASKGPRLGPLQVALLCAGLALLIRVVPALGAFHPTPDAVEYLVIARSLRAGRGLRLPIRAVHPPQPALAATVCERGERIRAPLLSFLIAPFAGPQGQLPNPAIQLLPALLAALAAGLAARLAALLLRREDVLASPQALGLAAGVAGLAVALYPPLFWCSTRLLSEPLSIALGLAALLAALEARPLLCGILAGAACLARPDGLLLAFTALALLGHQDRRLLPRGFIAFTAMALPWWLRCTLVLGNPMPGQQHLWTVASVEELTWAWGAESSAPTLRGSLYAIGLNLETYIRVMLEPRNAGYLALPVGAALFGWRRAGAPRRALMAFALGLLFFRSAVWATRDAMRYPSFSALLLFVAGAVELGRWLPAVPVKRRKAALGCALGFLLLLPGSRLLRRQLPRPSQDSWSEPGLALLRGRLGEGVIAGTNPWALKLAGAERCVLLPNRLEREALLRFLDHYSVAALWLSPENPYPNIKEPLRYAEWLKKAGWSQEELAGAVLLRRP